MTEQKWLSFAGFLSNCKYGLENPDCPLLKLQQLDQYQKLEWLMCANEKEAVILMDACKKHRNCCCSPVTHPMLKSLEMQLVP